MGTAPDLPPFTRRPHTLASLFLEFTTLDIAAMDFSVPNLGMMSMPMPLAPFELGPETFLDIPPKRSAYPHLFPSALIPHS